MPNLSITKEKRYIKHYVLDIIHVELNIIDKWELLISICHIVKYEMDWFNFSKAITCLSWKERIKYEIFLKQTKVN